MDSPRIDKRGLVRHLREIFPLDWDGFHGAPHWSRVRVNGLAIANLNGANTHVVELFALLHDSGRLNEHRDPQHGARGAANARLFRGRFFEVTDSEMRLLEQACFQHSDGHLEADVTVQTCWDADRLDLARVGIAPRPSLLCTPEARQAHILQGAIDRSMRWLDTDRLTR